MMGFFIAVGVGIGTAAHHLALGAGLGAAAGALFMGLQQRSIHSRN
jgi:hypothetical protein